MTPAEIVRACLETGDELAWDAFIQCFQPFIAARILHVVRSYRNVNSELADDLIQETYLRLCRDNAKALRAFREQQDEADILRYLGTIAVSVARDYFRGRATQKRRDEVEVTDSLYEPAAPAASLENAVLLKEFDDRLAASETERDRTIFWLYYSQGYTARDIATMPGFGLTEKGVESCIYRLLKILRTAFQPPKGKCPPGTLGDMT